MARPYDPHNIFAKVLRGELPSHKLHEDDRCLVILDIFPVNPGHLLVIPKEPAVLAEDLSDEALSHIMLIGARFSRVARREAPRCEDINFWIADGASAGQEVPHVHLHIIPRFGGDGFGWKSGPNNRQPQDPGALALLADRYRKTWESL